MVNDIFHFDIHDITGFCGETTLSVLYLYKTDFEDAHAQPNHFLRVLLPNIRHLLAEVPTTKEAFRPIRAHRCITFVNAR